MNKTAFKIAASTLIISVTMVSTTAQSEAMRRGNARQAASPEQQAVRLHQQALQQLQQGQLSPALESMENAVALSPRDAGYRMLLAEIYMKSGRFQAARATFADVVELNPSNTRAALSLALMEIATGSPQAAVGQLDELTGRAAPGDIGLAYALAGMPERAIEILEPIARSPEATPRLRQNLALSYALAGDWRRARIVASQDVSPADLGPRMQQWAAMARPDVQSNRVAALLNVNPVEDAGQPVRLALVAPAEAPTEAAAVAIAAAPAQPETYAAVTAVDVPASTAADAPAPTIEAPAPAPGDSRPSYLPAPEAPPVRTEAEVRYAAAAEAITRPDPAVVRTASVSLPAPPVFSRQAPRPANVRDGNSRFVVQLGAFSNEGNAERAWQQVERQFALGNRAPMTTTIAINGRTLHRVSVAGFASQADAARMCQSIRARGGACFVRANAGDASVRWAARYAQGRDRA